MKTMLVHQIDSMFGSSRMARYRAGVDANPGCGYSSDAAVYGYDNFVVPDVKRAHPDWTADQVTREALILFNLRFSENIASLRQEQKGESSTTIWREDEREGERILVIHGGKYDGYTLDRFWNESFTYDREKGTARSGSIEEYQAQKRIQRAILDGEATSSASIIGHPESVKLIQTFYRGSDGLYYSEQIDLEGLTGRTLTFSEGKAVMAALHHDHKHHSKIADAHHDHFMVTQGEITASEVKMIARAVVITSREAQPTADHSIQSEPQKQMFSTHEAFVRERERVRDGVQGNMFMDTSRVVFCDTAEAIGGIADLLRNKEKRKEATDRLLGLSIVQKIRRIFEKGDQSIDKDNAAALLLSINQKSEEGALHPKVQPERLTIEKIWEKPMRTVEIIRKQHEEMKKGMAVLGMIAETGVAIHAEPVILSRLKEKLPTSVVAMKKSIERHAKKELTRQNKELRKAKRETKKDSVKVQPLKTEMVEPLRRAKERKRRKKRSSENGIKKVAAASEIIPSASKKRERREKRKMRQAVEKSLRRHKKKELKRERKKDSVKVQPLRSERVSERAEPLKERKQSTKKNERAAVAGMWFAWMVWKILNRANFFPVGSKLAIVVSERRDAKLIHPPGEQGQVWVLLSIIWYLTMIRESRGAGSRFARQGMVNTTNTTNTTPAKQDPAPQDNTTNNPMKKRKILLPQYAVIFAYNS